MDKVLYLQDAQKVWDSLGNPENSRFSRKVWFRWLLKFEQINSPVWFTLRLMLRWRFDSDKQHVLRKVESVQSCRITSLGRNCLTDITLGKGKGKLSLHTPWRYTRGVEVWLHSFLTSTLDGGESWSLHSGRFIPGTNWIGNCLNPGTNLDVSEKEKICYSRRDNKSGVWFPKGAGELPFLKTKKKKT